MLKHKKLHSALLLITASSLAQAEIFLQEDFSGGAIPAGWTTDDPSGNGALWTYCADPNTGQTNGCPPLWDDGLNAQGPFAATTANNGFMTLDSDIYGNITHLSQLNLPAMDFSGTNRVFVEFESFLGAYTIVPLDNALFQVSNDDGANWTSYNPFPDLVTGSPAPPTVRWSANPTQHVFDVSAVAAGQSNVLMRWQWRGNFEYLWSIDDVVISDGPDLIYTDGFEPPTP